MSFHYFISRSLDRFLYINKCYELLRLQIWARIYHVQMRLLLTELSSACALKSLLMTPYKRVAKMTDRDIILQSLEYICTYKHTRVRIHIICIYLSRFVCMHIIKIMYLCLYASRPRRKCRLVVNLCEIGTNIIAIVELCSHARHLAKLELRVSNVFASCFSKFSGKESN